MKRIIFFIMALVCFMAADAKRFSYTFRNTPVSQALIQLSRDNPETNIAFVYKELDSYTTSARIDCDDIYTAIREIIGLNPVTVAERNGCYYIEVLQHGKFTFYGRIASTDGEPLPAATIMLLKPNDSTVVTYGISRGDGSFAIPCDKKSVMAKVVYMGYITAFKRPTNFNFGTIVLKEKPIVLQNVSIEGQTTILAPDKNTYIPTGRQKRFSQSGIDLLRHMAIPTLVIAPGSDVVTDVFGTTCQLFINFSPASQDDLNGLNISDVRKVEVYDSPSDPRLRGARKAINIMVQVYEYGGYTKLMASETAINGFSSRVNIYNKFTYKRMTYDLYLGSNNSDNHHTGYNMVSQYSLADGVISRNERNTNAKTVINSVPVTFRTSYNTNRLQIKNLLSYRHDDGPENSQDGIITYNSRPDISYDYNRSNRDRNNSLKYDGSLYWVHPRDFAIDYSQSVSYDHRSSVSNFTNSALSSAIDNDATENRTHAKFNLYGLKAFGAKHRFKFGGIFSYLSDNVTYHNSTEFEDCLKTISAGGSLQYVFSTRKINLSAIFGFGYERIIVNERSQNETSPYGNLNFSYRINNKNSISAYASLGMWTPDVDMRQDVIVRSDEFLYLSGNSHLKNYKELNTNLAYNFAPHNKFSMAAFTGYEVTYNRVATVYSPYRDGSALLRSFINNGDYSNFYFGASGNLRLFNSSLQLYVNATQKFYRTTGLYHTSYNPFRLQLQATQYFKSFYVLGAYTTRPASLTENSNIIIRGRDTYLIEAGWGNGKWTISLTAKNFLSNKWLAETWESQTPLYSQRRDIFSPNAHASLNLSVTYTINYGKKVRVGNEINHPSSTNSAIINPQ